VLLPIHRTPEEKETVLAACRRIESGLAEARFGGEPIRVRTDTREIRGGEKTWQHVKQGVPVRVEIGPRDLAAGTVSVMRRDRGPKERTSVPVDHFAATAADLLGEIQQGLFDRAREFRDRRSVRLDSLDAVREFFGADGEGKGGSKQGGFAHVHVADDPAVPTALDPFKVTVRCVPMDGVDEPGTCVITGKTVGRRSVLARSY
jgi:prolyl-tRNA synthetase